MTVDEKKRFLKSCALCYKEVDLMYLLWYIMDVLKESSWKGIEDFDFDLDGH